MRSVLAALLAGAGTYLMITPPPRRGGSDRSARRRLLNLDRRARSALRQAGLETISPAQFALTVSAVGVLAAVATASLVGVGVGAAVVGVLAAASPIALWRGKRRAARRAAQECWPGLIEELRVRVGPMGRPIPQALLEVGLAGPVELRPAFEAAQREWALSTDFSRAVAVLKERLADPTADATCETLLVAHEVGGDLDTRLEALADDRRRDLRDRKEAAAKQAGARLARWFVVVVPAGMAVAGLNVGDGRAAFRTPVGQVLVAVGVGLVVACWWWAGHIMRLPDEERVFDR
jgi:tight adherence protein B